MSQLLRNRAAVALRSSNGWYFDHLAVDLVKGHGASRKRHHRSHGATVTVTRSIDIDEVLEGLKQFDHMCAEHIQLLGEHAEALALMAPERPEDWPSFPERRSLRVAKTCCRVA
jgi:hypothetical protein